MIKAEVKKLPQSELEITVSVAWEQWKPFIDEAVKVYSDQIKIEGFRPGKAPRNMVEQKVGTLALLEEAAQLAIRDTYGKVLKEKNIDAIGSPRAEIKKLAEGNELEYVVKTAVLPEATLKPWRDAVKKVTKQFADKKVSVTDKEIDEELMHLANSRVILTKVDREAQNEDSVLVDFEVLQNGVPIEKGSSKNHPLVLGKGVFIPGFEEQVVGMKAGEEKEFELKFPEEYHEKSLAGKPATFKVKLNEVQERKAPEIDDTFAQALGKFENLEALKKSIADGLAQEQEAKTNEERRAAYVDALTDALEVELPEVLIHEELHRMLGEFDMQLQGMGMNLETYLQQMKKTTDDVEKEWHPQAEKRVKAAMALEQAAKDAEISIEQEAIEAEMNKTLQQYKNIKDVEKNIDLGRLYNYVKGMMQNEELFKYLEGLK